MTSEKSFLVKYLKNNTQHIWMWIVSLISFVIFYPALLVSYFNRVSYTYNNGMENSTRTLFEQEMREAVCDCIGFNSAGLFYVLAGIFAIGIFSYLNNKSKMDMLKSVPVSSRKMFKKDYITGILICVIPYFVNLMIAVIIGSVSGYMTSLAIGEMILATVINLVQYIIYYSLGVICVCITGNIFVSAASYLSVSLAIAALTYTFDNLTSTFFKTKDYEFVWKRQLLSPVIDYMNEMNQLKSYNDISEELKHMGTGIAVWTVAAAFLAFVAYRAYMKRPVEALNKVCYSRKIQILMKLILGIILTLFAASTALNSSGESRMLMVIVILVGGILVGMAFEAVFATDIRASIKSLWSTGAVVAVCMCVFACLQFDVLGYDRYVPTSSSVDSFAIDMSANLYVDVFEFSNDRTGKQTVNYWNTVDYFKENMIIRNIDAIEKLARKCADNKLYLSADDDNIFSYSVLYRMKGLGEKSRRLYVDLDDEESIELLNQIVGTMEWKTGFFQVLKEKETLSGMKVKISYNNGINTFLIDDSVEKVIDAFSKDIEKFDYYMGSTQSPVGMLYMEFGTGNCYSLPIYAEFGNILQMAQKCNGYSNEKLTADKIESIRVTNYHSEFWDGDTSSVAYDYTPEVTVTITDKKQIQDILDHASPSVLSKFWERYNRELSNYSIDVFVGDDIGEYKRGSYISFYFPNSYPEWLAEATMQE